MKLNRLSTRPLDAPRTIRRKGVRNLTSLPAGRVVPIATTVLLREDAVRSGKLRITCEMLETAELLMNAVYFDVKAYLVPWLAFERFAGSRDIFDRSYNGVAPFEGEDVVPFFGTHAMGAHGSKALYKYMGKHAGSATNVNTMYAEAYNAIWNFRAANRSPDIVKRTATDTTLAPAFWRHENFAHIVPDVDFAVIDGEVALNVVNAKMPVSGIGIGTGATFPDAGFTYKDATTTSAGVVYPHAMDSDTTSIRLRGTAAGATGVPDVYAELQDNGITVSLAKIEQARKTQAFARLREQYAEHSEDWIIDMLMSGLSIPDQALKQPLLLAERATVFGQAKRYSSDADALMASATNGASMAELAIRVPRLATGGVVMVTAEVTPEQMFERKKDYFFHTTTVAALPDYLRDELDDQKIVTVPNDYVDVDHDTPNGLFGYAPLNHELVGVDYNIGGKFYRPAVDEATDEERARFWAVETQNPVLSEDFFLCTTMHQKPFLDTGADPFEVVTVGEFMIEGNTVFGPLLVEAMENYEAVQAKAPTDHIDPA